MMNWHYNYMVDDMKGNLQYKIFFAFLIFIFVISMLLIFFINSKEKVLCTMENENIICSNVDNVNLRGVKLHDVKNKTIYIYDKGLFDSNVNYYSYVTSKTEIKTLNEIINDANRVNSGNNKIKIMKIDQESKYIIANDWDDNYTKDTINIDGDIIFISDSDIDNFDNFYGAILRKY